MSGAVGLEAIGVVELDSNADVMLVWSYPSLTPEVEEVVVAQATPYLSSESGASSRTFFTRYDASWLYITALPVAPGGSSKVTGYSVAVQAKTFDPEKWGDLAQSFAKQYFAASEPTALLESYLGAFTTGRITAAGATWTHGDYDTRAAVLANSSIVAVLKLFGVESVILWSALMLKKRVVVYADKLKTLQQVVRTLPQLVWHRQDWDMLRPWISGSDLELEDLKASGVYIAGVTDISYRSRTDLYDVFVDVPSQTIHTAEHARRDLELGSPHRDIANAITEITTRDGVTDQPAIKALATKTAALLTKIKSLPSPLTRAALESEELRLPPAVVRFLHGVALAEPSISTA